MGQVGGQSVSNSDSGQTDRGKGAHLGYRGADRISDKGSGRQKLQGVQGTYSIRGVNGQIEGWTVCQSSGRCD